MKKCIILCFTLSLSSFFVLSASQSEGPIVISFPLENGTTIRKVNSMTGDYFDFIIKIASDGTVFYVPTATGGTLSPELLEKVRSKNNE